MADFVRVPEADWQNTLDAVREKTGSTEKMLSGEVAEAVRGIRTGGGDGIQFLSGTFTPTEKVNSITLEFDRPISNVIIVQTVPTLLEYSLTYTSVHILGYLELTSNSNMSGTSWNAAATFDSYITITDDGLKLTSAPVRGWGAVEHKWIAW